MCGITGIFNIEGQPVGHGIVKRLTDALSHRGPDDEGHWVHENIGLGHRRLSILDTSSRGRQPMMSKNGEWAIVFNGCIYNYQALKMELRNRGHEFISTTDTEVISEGLAAYGPTFFERFDGMFAIAAFHIPSKKEIDMGSSLFTIGRMEVQ